MKIKAVETRSVFDLEGTLAGAKALLEELIDRFGIDARLEVPVEGHHGCADSLVVHYEREETEKKRREREKAEAKAHELMKRKEKREREEYERLKKKFEPALSRRSEKVCSCRNGCKAASCDKC